MSKQGKALTPQFKIPLRLINIGLLLQTVLALAGIFLFFWMPSHYGFNFKSLADYPDLIGTIGEFILYGIFGSAVSEKLKRHQNCSKLAIVFGVILLVVTVIATFGIAYWWYAYFAGVSAKAMTPAQISLVGNTDMLQLQHTCYNYILQILGYASAILMLSAGAYLAGTKKNHWESIQASDVSSISSENEREVLTAEEPHTHYRRLQHNVEDSAIKYHSNPALNKQKNVGANDVLTEFKHPETSNLSHSHSTLSPEVDSQAKEISTEEEHENDIAQDIQELKDQSYQDKLNQYIASAKHVEKEEEEEEEPLAEKKVETPHAKPSDANPDFSATQNPSGKKQNEPEQKKHTNVQSTPKNQNQSQENISHSENSSSKQNHRNNKNYRNRNKKKSYSNSSRPQNNHNTQNKQNSVKKDASDSQPSSPNPNSKSHSASQSSASSSGSQNRKAREQNGPDGMTNSSPKPKQPQRPRHPQVASQREQNLKG